MKFATVEEAFAALVGKVVVFNKLCETEYECDADSNMKGRVTNVTSNNHNTLKIEINLREFEAHNDPLMQKNYYDKDGKPTLTMKEAGMYTGEEWVFGSLNYKLPIDLEDQLAPLDKALADLEKLGKLAKEYRPSMDKDVLHSWAAEVVALLKN